MSLISIYENFLYYLDDLGFKLPKIMVSSELTRELTILPKGVQLVNYLLEKTKASTYLAAENTRKYANKEDYDVREVLIQSFTSIPYKQHCTNDTGEFIPNLSCLDIISNHDTNEILSYLDKANNWVIL